MSSTIPYELLRFVVEYCDIFITGLVSIASRDLRHDAWHFQKYIDFDHLDRHFNYDCKQTKEYIISRLMSCQSHLKSFVTSDFDVDGPYDAVLLASNASLRTLKVNLNQWHSEFFQTFVAQPKLRHLSVRFAEIAFELNEALVTQFFENTNLKGLETLSISVAWDAKAQIILRALRKSHLPNLQVFEWKSSYHRILGERQDLVSTMKHLQSSSQELRIVNFCVEPTDENGILLLSDVIGVPETFIEINKWPILNDFSQCELGIELTKLRFNDSSLFLVLGLHATQNNHSLDLIDSVYYSCYPEWDKLTAERTWLAEMSRRADEILTFVAQLKRSNIELSSKIIDSIRYQIQNLLTASFISANANASSAALINPVNRLVFEWVSYSYEKDLEHNRLDRQLALEALQIDHLNVAALALNYDWMLEWILNHPTWYLDEYPTSQWPEQVQADVSVKLWKKLLEQENDSDAFILAAKAIRRAFPVLPRRIRLFVTGEDRRETGPLVCKMRVREARKLLSEIIFAPRTRGY